MTAPTKAPAAAAPEPSGPAWGSAQVPLRSLHRVRRETQRRRPHRRRARPAIAGSGSRARGASRRASAADSREAFAWTDRVSRACRRAPTLGPRRAPRTSSSRFASLSGATADAAGRAALVRTRRGARADDAHPFAELARDVAEIDAREESAKRAAEVLGLLGARVGSSAIALAITSSSGSSRGSASLGFGCGALHRRVDPSAVVAGGRAPCRSRAPSAARRPRTRRRPA